MVNIVFTVMMNLALRHDFYCVCVDREDMPGKWNDDLDDLQKIIVLRCLRADKVTQAMQDFVAKFLGQRFIEPQVTPSVLTTVSGNPARRH